LLVSVSSWTRRTAWGVGSRLSQPREKLLVDRGMERDRRWNNPSQRRRLSLPCRPSRLESLVACTTSQQCEHKISHKLSFIPIVDCLTCSQRVLLTVTLAPNEPEDFGRMSALARALQTSPTWNRSPR
jgi:hypothetical protein